MPMLVAIAAAAASAAAAAAVSCMFFLHSILVAVWCPPKNDVRLGSCQSTWELLLPAIWPS